MSRITKHLVALAISAGIAVASCGVSARAQGSRKDDIVFNAQGRPMAGATVRVCTAAATGQPCSPLGLIYSDAALTQALANPISTDGLGNYTFYATPGRYEIEISGPSITTKQLPNVILPNDPSAPTFTTVTTTSGISAFSLSLSGNLSVSGSAAVTGTLTVGGAPVPSTTQDNKWSANQRFRGPIPWHDFTSYMPAGGCDNTAAAQAFTGNGLMTAGSAVLGIPLDPFGFKNGCGIFVSNVGPASTLATPAQGAAPNPNVVGPAGSTTVHYKVAAIDANYGTSAASAALTIATAPSTRTPINFVGIYWTSVANAVGYLVYTDNNGGGTYVPLGYSFDCDGFTAGNVCGGIDKGVETFSWDVNHSFWPTTPPAAVTNQALITTIVSGAGTLSLTLAATATNNSPATGYNSYFVPDNSPFFKQAIADAESDGSPTTTARGIVYVPQGNWFMSTIPFGTSGSAILGVKIVQEGLIRLFGLPIMGSLAGGTTSGQISISGTSGVYNAQGWTIAGSQITGFQSLGAIFVCTGSPSGLDLSHLYITHLQAGIIQQGCEITTQDVTFNRSGSDSSLKIDSDSYFSLFDRTNWNNNSANDMIPAIWYNCLTHNAHSTVFGFKDNAFTAHTIRVDSTFPGCSGSWGTITFSGSGSVEGNWDPALITTATGQGMADVVIDGSMLIGDNNVPQQGFLYNYSSTGPNPGSNVKINGANFTALVAGASSAGSETNCTGYIFETSNYGGAGAQSLGYWGNNFGTYTGCDLGVTQIGGDVQTNEVLTAGGNDGRGPAGEQMLGHIFRRPQTSVTSTGAGSLSAATYYVQVTMVDVAGRESAPSPEISRAVGASSSISLSSVTGIYFPASCNVYFGTSSGGEANFFNSTSVTNGTCTFTLTTISGATSGSPKPVGNAMRTWLSEENSANSCLFCGVSGGLGTGFLGFNLTAAQYGAPLTGVQFPFNGGVHSYKFYSASETTAPAGTANADELYADSTAHRWKKIENNGAVQTVGSADSSACAYQGPATAVTGTGAAATYFTCTLPAGVMGAGQGIIITAVAKHTTGTAAISYTLSFGGTSTTAALPGGAANQLEHITYLIMNNPGSTNAQTISTVGQDSNGGTNSIKLDTSAVSTASAVTINLQFNVAATDAITPEMFLVELKQ